MLAVCAGNGSDLVLFGPGFTIAAFPVVALFKTFGFLRSFLELSARGLFAVQPFPIHTCDTQYYGLG